MRIKFRAYDREFKKMYYKGFSVGHDGDLFFDPKVFKRGEYAPFAIDVMRSTEIKDVLGVIIFEGDKLRSVTAPFVTFIVSFGWNLENDSLGFVLTSNKRKKYSYAFDMCVTRMKIVGNIYRAKQGV